MNTIKQPSTLIQACALVVTLLSSSAVFAQAAGKYTMTTPITPGVAVPDKVETPIGTLNLNYGYPDDATTQKVYDNLDASRALQAYLLGIPIVNQVVCVPRSASSDQQTRRM